MDQVIAVASRSKRLIGFTAIATCGFLAAIHSAPATAAPSPDEIARSAARIEADVRFLADDLLEGREAGTRGFDLAALYVASQYRQIGLEPGGDDGTYFQSVPMVRGVRERDGARFDLVRDGRHAGVRLRDGVPAGNQLHDRRRRSHGPARVRRAGRARAGARAR
jgi:hypothetical protein